MDNNDPPRKNDDTGETFGSGWWGKKTKKDKKAESDNTPPTDTAHCPDSANGASTGGGEARNKRKASNQNVSEDFGSGWWKKPPEKVKVTQTAVNSRAYASASSDGATASWNASTTGASPNTTPSLLSSSNDSANKRNVISNADQQRSRSNVETNSRLSNSSSSNNSNNNSSNSRTQAADNGSDFGSGWWNSKSSGQKTQPKASGSGATATTTVATRTTTATTSGTTARATRTIIPGETTAKAPPPQPQSLSARLEDIEASASVPNLCTILTLYRNQATFGLMMLFQIIIHLLSPDLIERERKQGRYITAMLLYVPGSWRASLGGSTVTLLATIVKPISNYGALIRDAHGQSAPLIFMTETRMYSVPETNLLVDIDLSDCLVPPNCVLLYGARWSVCINGMLILIVKKMEDVRFIFWDLVTSGAYKTID